VLIRPARAEELAAAGEVTVAAYTSAGYLDPASPYVAELRDAATRAAAATLLVAVEGEGAPEPGASPASGAAVLGTVTFCLAGTPYAEVAVPGEAEFRMLAVDPRARGRGTGGALVRRCVELAEQAGASALTLCSMETMLPAQRIYRRLGFRRAPERDWEPTPGLRLVAFRLPL
jgi:ribosomal protein S18 acetylase RimI-like enzyme